MIPPDTEKRLRTLVHLFLEENAKVNLSALRTEEACWNGHVLDSLAFLDLPPPAKTPHPDGKGRILDLGTGGGFPLLPLAVMLPETTFFGLDATAKKIHAIERIVGALGLPNVLLLAGRAESLGHDARYREQFDQVTARAVADIKVLLEYCSPFVRAGGRVVLWKSMNAEQELKDSAIAQKEFRCALVAKHVYELPGDLGKRQLLVFQKEAPLSAKYPRAVGVAKKKPIA